MLLGAALLVALSAKAGRQPVLSDDSCRHIVERISEMHYNNPASQQLADALLASFNVLRSQPNKEYYLWACNKYVDWLFRHGDLEATKGFLDRVCRYAELSPITELKAIARRAQGQYLLRLGLTSLASSYIHDAMTICPDYKKVVCPDTYLSIGLQVIQMHMNEHRPDSAFIILNKVERGYMWHRARGYADVRNWMQARLLAMHADVELERGNLRRCSQWMERCRKVMVSGTPMSYYAPYYIIRCHLDMREGNNARALATVDSLLAIGPEVRPLTSQYLLMRAQLLGRLGRMGESAAAYDRYIKVSDRIDRLMMAERMEQLRAHFEYYKAVSDRKAAEHDRILMVLAVAVLGALLVVVIWAMAVLRRKNRHLVRLLRSGVGPSVGVAGSAGTAGAAASGNNGGCQMGADGVAFLTQHKAYCNIDGGRAALVSHLGVGERTAVAAVAAYTGSTFKTFTNMLKLEESRRLLEQNPEMTISAIASQCGFGTLRTYQSLFKEKYGLSPSQYRASLKEE